MRKQIVRFGVLAALLGLATVQGAKIKQANGFLTEPTNLAQTGAKCDIDETLKFGGEDDSSAMLHHGVF